MKHEQQTEFDDTPDEDEIIDPSTYEPNWLDRALVIFAILICCTAAYVMFGGKLT